MSPETIFYILIGIIFCEFLTTKILLILNKNSLNDEIPKEVLGIYDEKSYKKSQNYLKLNTKTQIITQTINFVILISVVIFGGFGYLDNFVSNITENNFLQMILFFGIVQILYTLSSLPVQYFFKFVIEEKFGFNNSSKKIFFLDEIKNFILISVVGFIFISAFYFIYKYLGNSFFIIASILVSGFYVFMLMFYTSLIIPIFNKQTPLEEGELKNEIKNLGEKLGFEIDNIYVINESVRSTRTNAFFSGLGKKRRIVFYDNLLNSMTKDEILATLAHEIGHYKKNHVYKMLFFGIFQTCLVLFFLGIILKNPNFSLALGGTEFKFHLSLIAFFLFITPLTFFMSILGNILSRKNEFEADNFAKNAGYKDGLISGLRKLTKENLSNLTPNKFYEFVEYSHPAVYKRIRKLEEN